MKPEAIVVLGAAQYDGRPSRILRARLDECLRIISSCPIITVGGKLPGDRFTEAEVGKGYLENKLSQLAADSQSPSKARQVHAVSIGSDTRGSLEAVRDTYPYRRVIIVTDPLHRMRTYLIARDLGFRARVVGVKDFVFTPRQAAWWRYLAHEVGGTVVFIAGKIISPNFAHGLRSLLHYIEGWIRPSRRRRHTQLRGQQKNF